MSDNRIISRNRYVVSGVSGATVRNNINRKPYTVLPTPSNKHKNSSDSSDDNSKSFDSHNSSDDNSKDLSNELENKSRLESEENARLVQAKFKDKNNHKFSTSETSEDEIKAILHHKLSDAMKVEVNTSDLCKKIEQLNTLERDSNK